MAVIENSNNFTKKEITQYRGKLLDWYDKYGRELPWRYKNGEPANPYHVWLSEIMCQQTTIQAVIPYYNKFLSTWPTIQDLANANNDDVMAAWAGLGYYARARNLHKCAKLVAKDLNGEFPDNQKALQELPGIGDYTSAAIASIAFNEPATVMDGNIERVMSRFFMIEDPLPKNKPVFKAYTKLFFEEYAGRPGDFAQGLMDLGAMVCTPKNPKCSLCPLKRGCIANVKSIQEELPVKIKGKTRPQKYGDVYWIMNESGEVLVHKRPEKGLLAGMLALPTSSWELQKDELTAPEFITKRDVIDTKMSINHVFTHFDLSLDLKIYKINSVLGANCEYLWGKPKDIESKLPTVFRKAFVKFMIEYYAE